MKTGMVYVRVSSEAQLEGTSLPRQEKECLEFARKNDVLIAEECIFREEGESAKVLERKQLQRLLEYVRQNKKKIDVLYIWKIDRLARNLGDYYGIKVALSRYDIKIISITEPIDDDPVGRFLEAILAAAAQFDNEIRAIRTTGGMRARVEQGAWPHDAPIGYLKKNKRVVVDPVLGPIITDILNMYAEGGYSYTDLSEYAFKKGIKTKTGKPKSTDQMKRIVTNYLYAGFAVNKLSEKPVKGKHKALVDLSVIKKNIDITNGTVKKYSLRPDDLYPLKGTVLCVFCKLKMTGSLAKGMYPLYSCNRPTCTKAKTGQTRASQSADKVHEDFRVLLSELKPLNPNVAKLYKKLVLKVWNDQYGKTIESMEDIRRRLSRQEEFKSKITQKFIADEISIKEKKLQMDTVEAEIFDLERELERLNEYKEQNESLIDNAMEFIEDPERFWSRSSTPVKRLVQQFLIPDGIPYDYETGYGTLRDIESYLLIKEIAQKGDKNPNLVAPTRLELVTSGL